MLSRAKRSWSKCLISGLVDLVLGSGVFSISSCASPTYAAFSCHSHARNGTQNKSPRAFIVKATGSVGARFCSSAVPIEQCQAPRKCWLMHKKKYLSASVELISYELAENTCFRFGGSVVFLMKFLRRH